MGVLEITDTYTRVLRLADVPPGGGVPVLVGQREIAVFNVGGVVHAVDNICPHKGAPLVDGALVDTVVTCPMHRWQFDVTTGRNSINPELRVQRFSVQIIDGDIWIRTPPEPDSADRTKTPV